VRDHVDAFEQASPRSWAYASDVLHALRNEDLGNHDLVRVALRGYLPTSWALLVTEALAAYPTVPELGADTLFAPGGDVALARTIRELEAGKKIDAIAMLAAKARRILATDERLAARVESGAVSLASLEKLLAPFPGDLREQCLESAVCSSAADALLGSSGHRAADLARSYAGSPLRSELQGWRRDMRLHRVRLVVVAVLRWLDRAPRSGAELEAIHGSLVALVADAGPLAGDLARWLRARGLATEAKAT
jgi:hypothetical protein